MANSEQLGKLQDNIGYELTNLDYLLQALTSADAVAENHDGNRRLAQLGEVMIQSALINKAFLEGASRR